MNQNEIKSVMGSKLKELMLLSKEYDGKIKTAKTVAKKTYFKKKLRKNNITVMNLLKTINMLEEKSN